MREQNQVTLFWPVDPAINDAFTRAPSIGMQYLSRVLALDGFPVTVIDSEMVLSRPELQSCDEHTVAQLVARVEQTRPWLLGIGAYTVTMPIVVEFLRQFGPRNPEVRIVLGGSNATFFPDETLLLLPEVDYLVRGEGELTLLELARALAEGREVGPIAGISYVREQDGPAIHHPDRPQIADLSTLPVVDIDHFLVEQPNYCFATMFDRGCFHRCTFCASAAMWGKTRLFPPERVAEQIKHYLAKDSTASFSFHSDNLFSDTAWLRQAAETLARELPGFKWAGCATLMNLNEELLLWLQDRGLCYLFVGAESILPATLRYFKKTANPEAYVQKMFEVLYILEKTTIRADFGFILGSPHETRADAELVIEVCRQINRNYRNTRASIQALTLYPGTELWRHWQSGRLRASRLPEPQLSRWLAPIVHKYDSTPLLAPSAFVVESEHMSIPELLDLRIRMAQDVGFMQPRRGEVG